MKPLNFRVQALRFGTDGIRGVANTELTPELAFRVGQAAASYLGDGSPCRVIVGRDTRRSGPLLEHALVSGVASAGSEALRAGVLPTPALAYLARRLEVQGSAVISASHNPAEYNGIKFFGPEGFKVSADAERAIELAFDQDFESRPIGRQVGTVQLYADATDQYIDHLIETTPIDLSGLRIAVDCAHGATYRIAPEVLTRLGAEVTLIGAEPDGDNINAGCGATSPELLQSTVREGSFQIGLAFDGDGDRLICVDERGEVVDGDFLLAIAAAHFLAGGGSRKPAMVVTVMSNLGLHLAMRRLGIHVAETKVGDRYVLEEMLKEDIALGGEQSGHIIFLEHTTTGDGVLTALQMLRVLVETGKPLSELAMVMERLPQELINVRVRSKEAYADSLRLSQAVAEAEVELGSEGRILVRPSGTEPCLRVMVEAVDEDQARRIAERVAQVALDELGGEILQGESSTSAGTQGQPVGMAEDGLKRP